ncbi:MAG: T9SS type A sorting domain-containing protein [Melioribacteraceae bacterium]
MRSYTAKILFVIILALVANSLIYAANIIPASNPYIQYFGRWDFTDPNAPSHSWPGTYIYAEFEGTSIGVRMNDNFCYYNVYIDGKFHSIFHPTLSGINSYSVVTGLADGQHTFLFTKRNETSWTKFVFNGLVLDDGKNLLPPKEKPIRKIEFVGDSFTSASGNEATESGTPADVNKVTNLDLGFGPLTAKHFEAQYQMSSISGYGMVMDYLGNVAGNVPYYFDRALIISENPKWDFTKYLPNLVVVCLGLNDYNGFGGYTNGTVSASNKELFKTKYHQFVSTLRSIYPGVKIMAFAAQVDWIHATVKEIVEEEKLIGYKDIFYADFPYYTGGYVNNGHPNVETHKKISDRLIAAIETIDPWTPAVDNIPPKIVKIQSKEQFMVYDKSYTLSVQTDSYSTLKYSTQDKSFDQMENTFTTTGKNLHSVTISCEHNKQYTFYVRAGDSFGNKMDTSAVINFKVDTTKILLNWKSLNYDDSKWKTGTAPLGSANVSTNTTKISKATTTYFRKKVKIEDASKIAGLGFLVKGNDGAVAYLNGYELQRINVPTDTDLLYNLFATSAKTLNTVVVLNAAGGLKYLKTGDNLFAVEMHSSSAAADIVFDSQLFDSNNKIVFKLGSDWTYSDLASMPADQIGNKTTDITDTSIPSTFQLEQNYPNPFNPETVISYQLSSFSHVTLKIYDMLGREIETLVNEFQQPGNYSATFTINSSFASGVYFYQLQASDFMQTRKMIVLK